MGFSCSLYTPFTLDSGKEEDQQISVGLCFLIWMKWHILETILQINRQWACFLEISISLYQPHTLGIFFFFLQILWCWVTEAPVSGSICADKIATHWGFFFSQKPDTWGRTGSPGNSPRAGTGFSWPASLLLQDIPQGMFPKVKSPRIPLRRLRLMLAGSTSHVFFSNIWIKNQKF